VAVWADTLSQHTVGKAGSGVLITRHTDPAGAEAVAPNAVCGTAGSGCGLAAHANPLHTRSKDASAVGAGTLSENAPVEPGCGSVVTVDPCSVGAGSQPKYAAGEARTHHRITEHSGEVRALAVHT